MYDSGHCLPGRRPELRSDSGAKSQRSPTARLLYHGDFDWGGVRSATPLARSVPWRPWRYTAPEYRAAGDHTGRGPGPEGPGPP
ncbi:DUF2399 domain-containing protein [Streptomyces sp. BB1-1-1]|uniref:DUF2399 domain-containing protein n=1 Tax=Streptomyces sp. BB1-1-1 TaxID=3074430 RepID=UPI0028777441|nr:DUF2399 domain-containing protein [Streptomyces sp. BB1-1-1]WND34370.1 DUF2399 domain-containing protein [Streptomyces sp. BB1-1-1]